MVRRRRTAAWICALFSVTTDLDRDRV